MKMYYLFVWFIGAFAGSALSVWFGFHWFLGAIAGFLTGVSLMVWREVWDLVTTIFLTFHRSKWTLLGWCVEVVDNFRTQHKRRMHFFLILFENIVPFHGIALLALFLFYPFRHQDGGWLVPIIFCTAALYPLLFAIRSYNDECEPWFHCPYVFETRWQEAKLSAIKWNIVSFLFTIIFLLARFLWRELDKVDAAEKLDVREIWINLLVALHSHVVITSGCVCAIGAVIGWVFQSPFVGGFVGLGAGCLEYVLARKFVPWVFVPR